MLLLFYERYIIFMYIILTKTCKIPKYSSHNVYIVIVTHFIAVL